MATAKEVIGYLKKLNPNEEIACLWITKDNVEDAFYDEKLSKEKINLILRELDFKFHEPSFKPEDNYVDYDEIIQKAYENIKRKKGLSGYSIKNALGRRHGDERLSGKDYENHIHEPKKISKKDIAIIEEIKSACEEFFQEIWNDDPQENPYEECSKFVENKLNIELEVEDEKIEDYRYLFSYKNVDFFVMDNHEVYYE